MSVIGFLFLVLLFVVLWPALKVGFRLWLLRRKFRRAYEQAADQAQSQRQGYRQQARNRYGSRPRRGKRIPADVGEYIDFEVISTVPDPPGPEVKFKRQEQISDAEWEEIQ